MNIMPPIEPDANKQAVLDAFAAQMQKIRERKEAASAELPEALEMITEALKHHWSTGSGRRLRQIVWSIYNASTLVALGDVFTNFDTELGGAVATLIRAKLAGALDSDEILRRVLKESGEFARYEAAERETPEDEEVLYPPIQVSAEGLRRLADSAARLEVRIKAERHAEAARYAEQDDQ
jgi:hypothetical protein